jgi:twitching motility protein PilT
MQFEKLFQLLAREDVKELALQADRPPCVLIGDGYTPVINRNFSEEEVIAALVEANGQVEVVGLASGARRWQFDHPSLGQLRVSAGYHGTLLQARLKRVDVQPAVAEKPATPKTVPFETTPAKNVEVVAVREPVSPAIAVPPARRPIGEILERPIETVAETPRPIERVAEPARVEHLGTKPDEIFESLLRLARSRRASDLHILAEREAMLRVGGDLVKVGPKLSADLVERMLMAQVPERLHAELLRDGSCDFALTHFSLGRFRTNVSRQRTGMKLTARLIGERVSSLSELGLPDAIAAATHHHQGLIVVTGPTGHGKTSTLAAIVDIVNRERTDHIITVEDPIEYVHTRKKAVISQREVGTHTKTFAAALKGSLREDPDVIAVGELRDTETVRMALSASETGHLVISTMNTPSAAKAIERLIDLFPPGDQPQVRMSLAGGLRMIISQRLVPSTDRKSVKAAVELLPGSPPLWALIRDNKTFQIPSLQQRGKALGIVRLDDSLADLVRTGHTTIEIAREYAEAPDQLETLVRGGPVKVPEAAPANDASAPLAGPPNAAQGAQRFGKDMLSKAGKLFGGDK